MGGKLKNKVVVRGSYLCFSFSLKPVKLTGNTGSYTKHPQWRGRII